jgi:hypothetical protein
VQPFIHSWNTKADSPALYHIGHNFMGMVEHM